MARIRLSVLERIARASGGVGPPPATVDDLRDEVVRHLEWILNSRRDRRSLPEALRGTALGFGLPEFKVDGVDEVAVRDRIADVLARAVRQFEPRLADVVVRVEPVVSRDLRLRVHLSANLIVEPDPEPFQVETLLDLSTREVVVT